MTYSQLNLFRAEKLIKYKLVFARYSRSNLLQFLNLTLSQAITTGGIPGFVDVVLNFDSTALQEDNIISQLQRAGKKMVFYGDDTWMKLFPGHFERTDGTTSFFVTDYAEVWLFTTLSEYSHVLLHMWYVSHVLFL